MVYNPVITRLERHNILSHNFPGTRHIRDMLSSLLGLDYPWTTSELVFPFHCWKRDWFIMRISVNFRRRVDLFFVVKYVRERCILLISPISVVSLFTRTRDHWYSNVKINIADMSRDERATLAEGRPWTIDFRRIILLSTAYIPVSCDKVEILPVSVDRCPEYIIIVK